MTSTFVTKASPPVQATPWITAGLSTTPPSAGRAISDLTFITVTGTVSSGFGSTPGGRGLVGIL